MGQHYLPQEYLRGFAHPNNPGMIWMYDKNRREFMHAPIKSVAQQKGYYTDDAERQLNTLVEIPANKVLSKLRSGNQIDDTDRAALTEYIGTMLVRVPRRRRVDLELFPSVRDKTFDKVSGLLTQWAQSTVADPELVARRFADLERVREQYQTEVPESVMAQIRDPWPRKGILSCISFMTWRIIGAPQGLFFLTSDNPAFFFGGLGGKPRVRADISVGFQPRADRQSTRKAFRDDLRPRYPQDGPRSMSQGRQRRREVRVLP